VPDTRNFSAPRLFLAAALLASPAAFADETTELEILNTSDQDVQVGDGGPLGLAANVIGSALGETGPLSCTLHLADGTHLVHYSRSLLDFPDLSLPAGARLVLDYLETPAPGARCTRSLELAQDGACLGLVTYALASGSCRQDDAGREVPVPTRGVQLTSSPCFPGPCSLAGDKTIVISPRKQVCAGMSGMCVIL